MDTYGQEIKTEQPYGTDPIHAPHYQTQATAPPYQPTTTQNVVIIQEQQQVGGWSTGLFGCFEDIGSCLASFFCHPFYKCYLSHKMEESCCVPICLGGGDLPVLRMKIRTMQNIQGGAITDCCASVWCPCCTAAQLSREWEHSVMHRK